MLRLIDHIVPHSRILALKVLYFAARHDVTVCTSAQADAARWTLDRFDLAQLHGVTPSTSAHVDGFLHGAFDIFRDRQGDLAGVWTKYTVDSATRNEFTINVTGLADVAAVIADQQLDRTAE